MRIAFSGTHRVGKSTLVEALADALPGYASVDEPYWLLEEDGYEQSDPPSIEDFEAQMERAILEIEQSDANVLFDRCPADVLAYMLTHDDAGSIDADEWIERAREALDALDLVVLVPIEEPDRVALPRHENRALRTAVDETLRELLLDDALRVAPEVIVVEGSVDARVERVLARITPRSRTRSPRSSGRRSR
jgi:predicted ATPase